MGSTLGCVASFSENVRWKLRDVLARWRALPKPTQWRVALSLSAVTIVALGLSGWLVFWSVSGKSRGNELGGDVTLYTSVDAFIAQPIVAEFEQATGVRVRLVTDTEATKTTQLVERLFAERSSPRCDVWWSSESLGTASLASRGVLETFASRSETDFKEGWPRHLRAEDHTWYGFAQRARVIGICTNRVTASAAPKRLRDLTDSKWNGRVGMARPQFGTTRTQIAALIAMHGVEPVEQWLAALKDNNVRLYDGNSAVARALSQGEIDVGLTDSDDIFAGKAQNWPIEMVMEQPDKPTDRVRGLPSAGPVVIPNTVAVIRGSPHPNEGRKLADFLLSGKVEELLAKSDARNFPIRPSLAKAMGVPEVQNPASVTPGDIAKHMAEADLLIGRMFPL